MDASEHAGLNECVRACACMQVYKGGREGVNR